MESIEVLRKCKITTNKFQIGDQIVIPLTEMGEFTATVHKVTDKGVLFIFDEYVATRRMNKKDDNNGGFEKSELKKWMDSVLFMAFPYWLRERITDLSIPTVGEMFGHEDEWDYKHFELDMDEQLPLMKEGKNRVVYSKNKWQWGWLRNAMKKKYSSAYFASVGYHNVSSTGCSLASLSFGVRPEFWLV